MTTTIRNKIFFEDCITGLRRHVEEATIDLIIADPPFGINFDGKANNYERHSSNVVDGYVDVDGERYHEFTLNWLTQCYRVLKPTGSAYVLSGWNHLKEVLEAIDAVGFTTINHIIWRYQFGMATTRRFVTSHYHVILVAKNENKYFFDGSKRKYSEMEDVWLINREYAPRGKKRNATTLPKKLVEKMMLFSSRPGDLVLDPFMGSGTTACVAIENDRNYVGFEINKHLKPIIEQNITHSRHLRRLRRLDAYL